VSITLSLFEGYGIELEYMIVDRETLAVRPIADEILKAVTGAYVCDYEDGEVAWSNELVQHVIELKMKDPSPHLEGWGSLFHADIQRIDELLQPHGARLLPTGMHPTMDPERDTKLWPHENSEIYQAYDRIFGCRRHGFANLQSCHLNLPFRGDAQFGALHAAIRAVLPLLPALSASSPIVGGKVTGLLDTRLDAYRTHQERIPSATGLVVPEAIYTRADYERLILQRMVHDIGPLDPEGTLRREFLNARGAIARFDRDAIEIRLLDVQETPRADLAIALLVREVVKALAEERFVPLAELKKLTAESLALQLWSTVRAGHRSMVEDRSLLAAFGLDEVSTAQDLWSLLAARVRDGRDSGNADWRELGDTLDVILEQGPLAARILEAVGTAPTTDDITAVYRRLADCLATDQLFHAMDS